MSDTSTQDFYDASVAIFSLIAYADQELHKREILRFINNLKQMNLVKTRSPDDMQKDLLAFSGELEANFEKTRKKAIACIQKASSTPGHLDNLIKLAQTAIVADEKLTESENQMIAYICQALGINPDKYLA